MPRWRFADHDESAKNGHLARDSIFSSPDAAAAADGTITAIVAAMLLQLRLEDRNVATATALIGDTATADAATIATKGDIAVIAIEVITATAAPATT